MQMMTGFLIGLGSFLIVLPIVIFVHEFGHYQVAKWLKVKIEKFSMGFGPELAAWSDKDGVLWRIGAYPIGGYVKFVGDQDASSFAAAPNTDANDSGLFHSKPVWVRALVTVAGPVYNFLFAILVFALMFLFMGEAVMKPVIASVIEGSTAQKIGLKSGDIIKSINDVKMESTSDVQRTVVTEGGKTLHLVIERDKKDIAIDAVPQIITRVTPFGDKQQSGALGINIGGTEKDFHVKKYNPISATVRATEQTVNVVQTQVRFIAALFRGGMSVGHVSGPLGIGQTAGLVAKNSVEDAGKDASLAKKAGYLTLGLIRLAAVLSISIGFMNLLPLPILDGGHLVFYAFEAIRGKPVPEKVQATSFKIGFMVLMTLFAFVTFQDLLRLGLFRTFQTLSGSG